MDDLDEWERRTDDTYLPGEVLVSSSRQDKAAYEVVFGGAYQVERLDEYLRSFDLRIDDGLDRQFARIRCAPGEERATIEELSSAYLALARDGPRGGELGDAVFAVNSILRPTAPKGWFRGRRASPVSAAEFVPGSHLPDYMHAIGLEHACACTKDVTVLIVDSGVAADLRVAARTDRTFIGHRNAAPYDDFGHGTALARIIYDIVPSATLVSFKVIDERGVAAEWDVVAAILAVTGANVVNLSLASQLHPYYTRRWGVWSRASRVDVLGNAVRATATREPYPILVAGAGNDSGTALAYPARFGSVVAVGAITSDRRIASYSNTGDEDENGRPHPLRHFMPGGGGKPPETVLRSARYPDGTGTSFAAAFASGVVARHRCCGLLEGDALLRWIASRAVPAGVAPAWQPPTLTFSATTSS